MEKIINRYNLLCIKKKEEIYYRALDGRKSTIDLTITSLTIAPELIWSKEFELRESNHFPIIIEKGSLHETTEIEHEKSKLDAVSERAQ